MDIDPTLFVVHTQDDATVPVLRIRITGDTTRQSEEADISEYGVEEVKMLRELEHMLLHDLVWSSAFRRAFKCVNVSMLTSGHLLPSPSVCVCVFLETARREERDEAVHSHDGQRVHVDTGVRTSAD